jgi:orotate phosphoribosyltransferase
MDERRKRLLEMLLERSFRYSEEPPFRLASGRESPYYVDCRPVTHSAEGMALIGEILFQMLRDLNVQAVGGLTMGADPISHSVALVSWLKGRPMDSFSVRRAPKDHGIPDMIVGAARKGQRAAIVDDVLTTGGSVLKAAQEATAFGLDVVKVVVLVDREEGGREAVAQAGLSLESVFRMKDLKKHALRAKV